MVDPILVRRDSIQSGGTSLTLDQKYEPHADGTPDPHAAADMALAKNVGDTLFHFYPGHLWAVQADTQQGVVLINIPVLMGNFQFVLKMKDITAMHVMKAGGQILERFKIPRSGVDFAAFEAALKHKVFRINHKMPE